MSVKHLFYNKKEHLYWFATPGEAARAGGYVKSNGQDYEPEEEVDFDDDTEALEELENRHLGWDEE